MKMMGWLLLLPFAAMAQSIDSSEDLPSRDPSSAIRLKLDSEVTQKSLFLGSWVLSSYVYPTSVPDPLSNLGMSYRSLLNAYRANPATSDFNLFKAHAYRELPSRENAPSFINTETEFKGVGDREYGYCWGMSTLIRYFDQLAFFDPSQARDSIARTQEKIDSLMQGRAVVFNGFHHLRELSLVPELELYLKVYSMELWRSRAVRVDSLEILRGSSDRMTKTEILNFANDLEARLSRGETPKLIFSSVIPQDVILGMNTNIHVVLASRVERLSNGEIRIHIFDVNFYGETMQKDAKFFRVTSEGKIIYSPWLGRNEKPEQGGDQIAKIAYPPENDDETVQIMLALKRFCTNRTTLRYCQ